MRNGKDLILTVDTESANTRQIIQTTTKKSQWNDCKKEQRKGQLQEDAQDFALASTDSCHLQRKEDNVT